MWQKLLRLCIKMETEYSQNKINEGLINLLEKKLTLLEGAINNGGINDEVKDYFVIEKIAEEEGFNVKKYSERQNKLVKEYNNGRK